MPSSKVILIVDDSPLQAIVLRRTLLQAGYQVITVKNGKEAFDFMKKRPEISLVISDINMPIMDGFTLCRAIKTDSNLWKVPVILCTALSNPVDLIRGIEVGADNYITRPWNDEDLLVLIEDLMKAPPRPLLTSETESVTFNGQNYQVSTSRQYILNFLLSTYQNIHQQNKELNHLREEIQKAYGQLKNVQKEQEQLLLNIFPESVAQELIAYGSVNPVRFEEVSVMFVDFVGFTKSSTSLPPQDLVSALEFYFEKFDEIIDKWDLERIKTIGDGYMCVGGLPIPNETHALNSVRAALEIQSFVQESIPFVQNKYKINWKTRIGIHTGPVVAGVIGKKRLAYDIWGATVNLANRMESHCEPDKINISSVTYEKIKEFFSVHPRGNVAIKNKEGIEMYVEMFFVNEINPKLK